MRSTILPAVAALSPAVLAAPPRPDADAVPSVHPLTGPAPPAVPVPPHAAPHSWTPPATTHAGNSPHATPGKYWTGWKDVSKLFVFGDSYTTTGFNVTMAQPSPDMPFGNPAYPGYTSSNGPNYIDYMTTTYNESLIETYNLAYGGATVDSDLVAPYEPQVLSFQQQVNDEFIPYYVNETNADWTSANSLFVAFFGINDAGNSYYNSATPNATLNGEIFTVYSGLVEELYQSGARNFLFLNVPPTNLAPLTTAYGTAVENQLAADIADFNTRISQAASTAASYADTTVFVFDTNGLFNQVLQNPASYPQTSIYKNTTGYCVDYENGTPAENTFDADCGIPVNEYFWLNTLHPTYPMHDVLGQKITEQLEAGTTVS